MRRKISLVVAGATVAGAAVFTMGPADAHGGLTYPATRTYACYVDGLEGGNGGDLNPTNPACADAVAAGGKQPLWDWFGNLLPTVGDQHRQTIADGELCGPSDKYDAYNMARTDWPTTDLTPGETITMRYNAWAAHPGTWSQYITRDGWDPTQPLGWDDLEPAPFDEVVNPPINSSGPHGAEYSWDATLPADKSGRHIIFSIWERSDSPEAFYNCSDVNFGGSSNPAPTPAPTAPSTTAPPATTTTTAPTPTTTTPAPAPRPTPPTTVGPPAPRPPAPTPRPPAGPGTCAVEAEVTTSWPGGYLMNLTVTNTGSSAISGWDVEVPLDGSTVGHGWGGSYTSSGGDVSITPETWNADLAPGATASAGFVGDGTAPETVSATCSS